ncbi:MAG: hypothetical protein ACYST6_10530 [Planctomycetota bacterium]|jgi:predicted outer membrane repeat protein
MRPLKTIIIGVSILIALCPVHVAIAGYTTWTPITNVTITSHSDGDIVLAGCQYTLTCTTSTDVDCHDGDHTHNDPVVHTWSGPGTFDPTTGTSVTWTAPCTGGNATITVTASDNSSPVYANDTDKTDSVTLAVHTMIYVNENATVGNDDGTTWANAFLKLQDALDAADSDCLEIWVAKGTYYPDEGDSVTDNDRTESFHLIDGVELYGGFDPKTGDDEWAERDWLNNQTILSGDIGTVGLDTDNSYHVVFSENCDSDTVLDGFTIRKGNANYPEPAPTSAGGGMYSLDASTKTANCTFTENNATWNGGAIFVQVAANSVQEMTNCVFTDNTCAGNGGALFTCGVYRDNDQLKMTKCVIANNSAESFGGGMFAHWPAGHIYANCLFTGNHSDDKGGAIYLLHGDADFLNLTVAANDAAGYGGGICTGAGAASYPKLTNCIFWDNDAYDGGEIYNYDDASDPNFSYCDIEGGINGSKCGGYDSIDGGGNIDAEPDFAHPSYPDGLDERWMTCDDGFCLHPNEIDPNSPCIDAGDNYAISELYDIIGAARKVDDPSTTDTGSGTAPIVDMGSYEYDSDRVCID